jgi:hypothetical protein
MVTRQGYGLGTCGCNKLCLVATGLSSVALLSLSMLIKDRSLLWIVVRSQTYYLECILAYGSRKARCSLLVGFGSFRTN